MQISSNMGAINSLQNLPVIKPLYSEKISKEEVAEIKQSISQNANAMAFNSASTQNAMLSSEDKFERDYQAFQTFLSDIGYEGKAIAELTKEEATELVSEDGFFGVAQTSERIANFVIDGAVGNEDLLRAGREGMIQGFKDAENMWGGELPEISQQTMQAAIEMVDKAMYDLGFPIINQEV